VKTLYLLGPLQAQRADVIAAACRAGYAVRLLPVSGEDLVAFGDGAPRASALSARELEARLGAWLAQPPAAAHASAREPLTTALGARMVPVPSGIALDAADRGAVVALDAMFAADFPITNAEWERFVAESGYDGRADCPGIEAYRAYDGSYREAQRAERAGFSEPGAPAVCISWRNAVAFAEWLTACERARGRIAPEQQYRLPSETEWEYLCAAGTTSAYWYGDRPDAARMNYDGRTGAPTPRAAFGPNPWGLYDVHGNIFEWCADVADRDAAQHAGDAAYRVNRGGSWASPAQSCRTRYRHWNDPLSCHNRLGARLVLAAAPPAA